MSDWIAPQWQAPAHVRALSTTRRGGVSHGPYSSMNPASHVGDDIVSVNQNRQLIQDHAGLHSAPFWLDQFHSTKIADLDSTEDSTVDSTTSDMPSVQADGSTTARQGKACVVMTADCLPVLLTDRAGQRVAALHAGWRGLADGILEAGVKLFAAEQEVIAWLGPAIGAEKFEVGDEVIERLVVAGISQNDWCQRTEEQGKWLVDVYSLARLRLLRAGAVAVSGGDYCTVTDDQRFFSYRRQGDCGRMATLIWLDHQAGDGQISPS